MRHFEAAYGDMTSREFVELMALERMDPATGTRLDSLFAMLCAVVANSRMAAKGAKSFSPSDFLPDWSGQRKKKSLERTNIERIFRQVAG